MTFSRTLPALLAVVLSSSPARSATILQPGDLSIVAYASDEPDAFAFVTWVELDAGTEVFFTDKGWTCTGLQSGESVIKYTTPPGGLSAGAVEEFVEGTSVGPDWTVVSGSVVWSSSGDQLIAYQGVWNDDPTLITAFDTTGVWESCDGGAEITSSVESALPAGLVDGVSAVTFAHRDNFWYKPWYATSATLPTLKEWTADYDRFVGTSWLSRRTNEWHVPTSFRILAGQRGVNGHTEYIPGTAPCVILTGHDGDLYPSSVADRNHGCLKADGTCDWSKTCAPQNDDDCRAVTLNDENTMEMARRAADHHADHAGARCHLVVNRLGRVKLDPNREVDEATQGDPIALAAYDEFHSFADTAASAVTDSHGRGLVVDFHGHGHPEGRIEIGYKLTSSQLRESDSYVDNLAHTSSVKNLGDVLDAAGAPFSTLIRGPVTQTGPTSMGALFELPTAHNATGYVSVPSPTVPGPPPGESYFQGGHNIERHGSQFNGGTVDAVQIEFPRWVRADDFVAQEDLLKAFGTVVLPKFLKYNYDL